MANNFNFFYCNCSISQNDDILNHIYNLRIFHIDKRLALLRLLRFRRRPFFVQTFTLSSLKFVQTI